MSSDAGALLPVVIVRDASGAAVGRFEKLGEHSLPGLDPGSYSIVAEAVVANGFSYGATVSGSPVSIVAGETASASVQYAATTGTLAVTVAIGNGLLPAVELRDAGGTIVRRISNAGLTTLTGLAPGAYQLVGNDVAAGSYTWTATSTGSPLTVSAGAIASASVSYAASTGALGITITAPAGMKPSVAVMIRAAKSCRRSPPPAPIY